MSDAKEPSPGGRGYAPALTRIALAGAFPAAVAVVIGAIALLGHPGPLLGLSQKPLVDLARLAWSLLVLAALAGFASMAVIQSAKQLLGLRGLYQEQQVRRWLAGRSPRRDNQGFNERRDDQGFNELLQGLGQRPLGAGEKGWWSGLLSRDRADRRHLFGLPIEQLSAQVSAVADLALAEPESYQNFLKCLAGERAWGMIDDLAGSTGGDQPAPSAPSLGDEEQAARRMQVAHLARGGIDLLQVSVGQRWRQYVRATATWLSGLVVLLAAGLVDSDPAIEAAAVLAGLLFGGFFAWFARDIVAAVERLRR